MKRKFFIVSTSLLIGIANSYAQWVPVDLPLDNNSYLYQIKYSSQNKVWGIGRPSYQLLFSNDGGYTFKINRQTGSGEPWPVIFVEPLNDSVAFAIAQTFTNSTFKYVLLKTVNGGDSVQQTFIINGTDTAFSKTRGPQIIKFFDNQRGFIIGDTINGCSEIYTTKDGGESWNSVPCGNIHFPKNIALSSHNSFVSSDDGFGGFLCGTFGISKNYFLKTNDYGDNWDSIPFKGWNNMGIDRYAFKDSLNGIATLFGINPPPTGTIPINTIAITMDGGKTWNTSYSVPDAVSMIDYARDSASGKSFYIAAGVNGSYVSADDGKTWKLLDVYRHDAIAFYNSHTGISSHPKQYINDGILIFSGLTGIDHIEGKAEQITIYPNPAKNTITLSSSQSNSIIQIDLVDLVGKNYSVNFKKENEQSVVDVSELPTGIYFLQVKTNEGVLYKKVLIER